MLTTNGSGDLEWQTIDMETPETFWVRAGNRTHLKNSNDNVGIGKNNPKHSLHIYRDLTNEFSNNIQPATIRLENLSGSDGIGFVEDENHVWDIESDNNKFNLK